ASQKSQKQRHLEIILLHSPWPCRAKTTCDPRNSLTDNAGCGRKSPIHLMSWPSGTTSVSGFRPILGSGSLPIGKPLPESFFRWPEHCPQTLQTILCRYDPRSAAPAAAKRQKIGTSYADHGLGLRKAI